MWLKNFQLIPHELYQPQSTPSQIYANSLAGIKMLYSYIKDCS